MVNVLRSLITLLIILVTTATGCTSHYECAESIPEDIRQTIRYRVDHGHNAGIVVGVVTPSGTEYCSYGKTAGLVSQAVDENTVFEIGSITKVFTSLLLADMVERAEVSLDDPIEKYLPDSVTVPTRNGQSITLAHLATHTSNLPRMPSNFSPANPSNPYADYTVEQLYQFLSNHTLGRDIGAQYEYSNVGAGLLGHILALRSGMAFEELIVQRIADELGMPDTRISLTPEMRSRLARGHRENRAVANWDIPTLAGAGALRSTARDMLTFLAANIGLQESRLLPAMQTTHESRYQAGLPTRDIGLGWHIRTNGDKEIIWHNGGTGGYRSFAGFVRGEQRGVVVLTNTFRTIDEIGFHLLDPSIPLREFQEHTEVKVDPAVLKSYAGQYQFWSGETLHIRLQNDQLIAKITGQPEYPIYAESGTEFFFKDIEAQIAFVKSDQGDVTSLVLYQGGFEIPAEKTK